MQEIKQRDIGVVGEIIVQWRNFYHCKAVIGMVNMQSPNTIS